MAKHALVCWATLKITARQYPSLKSQSDRIDREIYDYSQNMTEAQLKKLSPLDIFNMLNERLLPKQPLQQSVLHFHASASVDGEEAGMCGSNCLIS